LDCSRPAWRGLQVVELFFHGRRGRRFIAGGKHLFISFQKIVDIGDSAPSPKWIFIFSRASPQPNPLNAQLLLVILIRPVKVPADGDGQNGEQKNDYPTLNLTHGSASIVGRIMPPGSVGVYGERNEGARLYSRSVYIAMPARARRRGEA